MAIVSHNGGAETQAERRHGATLHEWLAREGGVWVALGAMSHGDSNDDGEGSGGER